MPVTTPDELTVPIVVGLLLHEPPLVVSAKVVVSPAQTTAVPVIGAGSGLIEMVTEPVIIEVQPVIGLVAVIVYIPAAVSKPKSSDVPVPDTAAPTGEPPENN